jgi:hypothetical protein
MKVPCWTCGGDGFVYDKETDSARPCPACHKRKVVEEAKQRKAACEKLSEYFLDDVKGFKVKS